MKLYPRHTVNLNLSETFACLKEIVIPQGNHILEFETRFAQYCNTKFAVSLPSCRFGIYHYLKTLNLNSRDEIIVPAFGFEALPFCVSLAGAKPVFVELDENNFNIDVVALKQAITPQTKAILVSHLFGKAFPLHEIEALVKENKIKVIEDCAHSFGSTLQGRHLGSIGEVGLFSFGVGKGINTCGGGMLTTNNPQIYEHFRGLNSQLKQKSNLDLMILFLKTYVMALLTQGIFFKLLTFPLIYLLSKFNVNFLDAHLNEVVSEKSLKEYLANCSKLSQAQAKLGVLKLEQLEGFVEALKQNASVYDEKIKGEPSIKREDVPTYYMLRTSQRNSARHGLLKKGIDTKACDMINCATSFDSSLAGKFVVTDKVVAETFEIPHFASLKLSDLEYIANHVKRYVHV